MDYILNIDNFDFEFKKGVNCISGKNGSGKTTLVKKIIKKIDSQNIGVCLCNRTVFENLKLCDQILLDKQIMEFEEIYNLSSYGNKTMKELSLGTRQKYLVNRAFAKNSSIIILDEPFNYLDKSSCEILINRLCRGDKVVILVDNMKKISKFEKMYFIEDGSINEKY